MSDTEVDSVTVDIDKMFHELSSASSNPTIFRVDDKIRRMNPKAYDPNIVAIGPLHHGQGHLQNMEQHKVRYLKQLLEKRNESRAERYVTAMRNLEDRARKCYAEAIPFNQDEFVKMLLLDGCFVIEFLRKIKNGEDDPLLVNVYRQCDILNDFLLFENQLPFFIVDHLFNMTKIDDNTHIDGYLRALFAQNRNSPIPWSPIISEAHHLLSIVYDTDYSSVADILSDSDSYFEDHVEGINSAIELEEAGITFKRSEQNCFLHIEFNNKEISIPAWTIGDDTELLFRNLIAYEYYTTGRNQNYVSDYIFFMNFLIRSVKDVKLLRSSGIIISFLGDDKTVFRLISELGKNIYIYEKFSYSNIINAVNNHCRRKRYRWIAALRHNYFNNPWSLISVFAAITLLLLAIIQTTFAILSYRP